MIKFPFSGFCFRISIFIGARKTIILNDGLFAVGGVHQFARRAIHNYFLVANLDLKKIVILTREVSKFQRILDPLVDIIRAKMRGTTKI